MDGGIHQGRSSYQGKYQAMSLAKRRSSGDTFLCGLSLMRYLRLLGTYGAWDTCRRGRTVSGRGDMYRAVILGQLRSVHLHGSKMKHIALKMKSLV